MSEHFKGKVALVTGASRGLGFAVAEALGVAGAQVIAVARTVGGLEELDDRIKAGGGDGAGAVLVPVDITDDPALERLGAAVHERWGRLDLWVHTAVQAPPRAPVEHVDAKELDRAVATNLRAVQRLIRVLDPLLRLADGGQAVFCADPSVEGTAFDGAFAATRVGQRAIVEAWAKGAASGGIQVRHVLPPAMRTATRARFYPGKDPADLAAPDAVAARLLAALDAEAPAVIDLR